MEKDHQENGMQLPEHEKGQRAVDLSMNTNRNEISFSSSGALSSANLDFVILDVRSKPFLYFHENILKDYMNTSIIDTRIETVSDVKHQLIEELKNICSLQKQMQDLLTRYQQYKKS